MILVTGGTGFVGGHLIRRLRQEGLPVRALARHPDRVQPLKDLGVEVVPGDISDKVSLEKAAEGIERVIHLVGHPETPGSPSGAWRGHGTLSRQRKRRCSPLLPPECVGTRPGAKMSTTDQGKPRNSYARVAFPYHPQAVAYLWPRR
jgi:hypothetical protein